MKAGAAATRWVDKFVGCANLIVPAACVTGDVTGRITIDAVENLLVGSKLGLPCNEFDWLLKPLDDDA